MSSQNQNNLISRRDLLKLGATATVGACCGSLIIPKLAFASNESVQACDFNYSLDKIENPKIRNEWKKIVEESYTNSSIGDIELTTLKVEYLPAKRIGEVESIHVSQRIGTGGYSGQFDFYCNYRAMLNSNGVKVFDEIINTGVYPRTDNYSVEITYNEISIIDSRRTCQNLIAGVFGIRNDAIPEPDLYYLNQALAVEYYAPYGTGQVLLP